MRARITYLSKKREMSLKWNGMVKNGCSEFFSDNFSLSKYQKNKNAKKTVENCQSSQRCPKHTKNYQNFLVFIFLIIIIQKNQNLATLKI